MAITLYSYEYVPHDVQGKKNGKKENINEVRWSSE